MKVIRIVFLFIALSSLTAEPIKKNSEKASLVLTLQKKNLFLNPIGKSFKITIQAERQGDKTTLKFPPIRMDSNDSEYYCIETISGSIPISFRPSSAMPVSFDMKSKGSVKGYVDRFGGLTIAGPEFLSLHSDSISTQSVTVEYPVEIKTELHRSDFPIASGLSKANVYVNNNPSLLFDYGDYHENKYAFRNGILYTLWSDNSLQLPSNVQEQKFKAQALARIDIDSQKNTQTISPPINLSRTHKGGSSLPKNCTYTEGSCAIDPSNENNVFVVSHQKKSSLSGFILHRSFDGGETWSFKKLGFKNQSIPKGGTDIHIGFDRFGGCWITYMSHTKKKSSIHLIYSGDLGSTWVLVKTFNPYPPITPPPPKYPGHHQFDRIGLGIGPDVSSTENDVVWIAANCKTYKSKNHFTTSKLSVFGLRIFGLNSYEIAPTLYTTGFSTVVGSIPSIDVGKNGEVAVAFLQESYDRAEALAKPHYIEKKSGVIALAILKKGLLDYKFSEPKPVAYISMKTFTPIAPHRLVISNPIVAFDRSEKFPNRIYLAYHDRAINNAKVIKPYLTWSNDDGQTWNPPQRVTNDSSPTFQMYPTLAVDPATGKVAITWLDSRHCPNNRRVRLYGNIFDPPN